MEEPKDVLRVQGWGTGVGISKTHPSPGQPQVCTALSLWHIANEVL